MIQNIFHFLNFFFESIGVADNLFFFRFIFVFQIVFILLCFLFIVWLILNTARIFFAYSSISDHTFLITRRINVVLITWFFQIINDFKISSGIIIIKKRCIYNSRNNAQINRIRHLRNRFMYHVIFFNFLDHELFIKLCFLIFILSLRLHVSQHNRDF